MNLQKQLSYFKSACLKLSKWKVSCGKNFNFESKTHYLSSFGLHFSKTIVIFEISILEFFKMKNFIQNRKACDQTSLIWVFLSWNLTELSSYFRPAPSKVSQCKVLREKKMGPKISDLGVFGLQFWKINSETYDNCESFFWKSLT